eukprot:TRINITY_DN690_c1_g1_i1.p2 TRINITY_DN690_c1_g1~~TRINITY_DN690_c1_g1_i1.p2  ORF type:complete len:222 (+),score=150.45 TRINITY_DN690_c1_g1_i1:57-722(+)
MGGKKMNRHAAAAAERDEVRASAQKAQKQAAEDDAYWADSGDKKGNKKAAKAEEEARKQREKQMKKEEAKAFEREENARMEGKKEPKKVTQFEMEQQKLKARKAAQLAQSGDKRVVSEKDQEALLLKENTNENQDVDATGVDGVMKRLEQVDITGKEAEDMNPERRMKAAHAAFDKKMMPILKADNPGLKRTQLKEMCWKLWNKSPENPLVAAAAAQSKKK